MGLRARPRCGGNALTGSEAHLTERQTIRYICPQMLTIMDVSDR